MITRSFLLKVDLLLESVSVLKVYDDS